MKPAHHWKLGLFVVGSVAVGLAAIGSLAASELDDRVDRFFVYFDEPVQGLSVGSQVMFRGIPVGNVGNITIAPDRQRVQVETEISVQTVEQLGIREPGQPSNIEELRARGLRVQLMRNALTGQAQLNADFFDPERYPEPELPFEVPEMTVSAIPSTFGGIIKDAADAVSELPALIARLDGLVVEVEQIVTDLELPGLTSDARQLITTAESKLSELDVPALQGSLRGALDEARASVASLRTTVDSALADDGAVGRVAGSVEALAVDVREEVRRAELAKLSGSVAEVMGRLESAARSVDAVGADLQRGMPKIVGAFESVRRLADLLERDPGALLYGRTRSRIGEERR